MDLTVVRDGVKTQFDGLNSEVTDETSRLKSIFGDLKFSDIKLPTIVSDITQSITDKLPSLSDAVDKIPSTITDAITKIKLPYLPSIGSKIPDGLGEGITRALPKLAGDASLPLAVVTTGVQGVYQYTDTVHEGPIGQMLSQWGLSLPAPLKKIDDLLSPVHILGAIVGPGAAEQIVDELNHNLNNPVINTLNRLPGDITQFGGKFKTIYH